MEQQHTPCPRIQRDRSIVEHLDCPYCFGSRVDVATGERKTFCDFEPRLDPIAYGFPLTSLRWRAG
jgi:hypothetical protein